MADNMYMVHSHESLPVERQFHIRVPGLALWVLNEIFMVSLITYVALYLIDSLMSAFVTKQFNMDIVLWIVIASGTFSMVLGPKRGEHEQSHQSKMITWKAVVYVIGLGVIAGVVMYAKTKTLGRMGLLVSVVSALLVILLSFVLLFDSQDDIQ